MDFFALIPVAAAIVNFLLGIFVATQGTRQKINLIYCSWALALVIWNAGTALAFFARNPTEGLLVARFLQIGVIGLPFLLYHLCAIVSNRQSKTSLTLLYTAFAAFLILNFSGNFVIEVRYVNALRAYYTVGGYSYLAFFIVCMIVSGSAVVLLHRAYHRSSLFIKRRIKTLLLANYLIVIFGGNDILPIIGIYTYPFTNIQILPLGSAAAIFYGLMVGYSVLQDQLLDVRLSVGRSMANILRALQVTVVGLALLIIVIVAAPKGTFTMLSILLFAVVLVCLGIVAAAFFPQMFGHRIERLEKTILGDYFEYQDQVTLFIKTLPWYTKFDSLFDDLELLFAYTLRVEQFRIILLDETGSGFTFFQAYPPVEQRSVIGVGVDSRLFKLAQESEKDVLIIEHLEADDLEMCRAELRGAFQSSEAALCFPFKSDEVTYGFLLANRKNTGDPYTRNDIQIITSLVKNLGLVINQIRLKDKLQVEQELDLLGRISKGLAHDLNNLLTPVWTLLQVAASTENSDPEITALIASATQNVTAMRNYIRDSLFFSKTMKPQMANGKIHDIVAAALGIMASRIREKRVHLKFDSTREIKAVVDVILFQRLVTNLVSNAIDASVEGSIVEVDVQSIQNREDEPNWLQLRVIDYGEGITPENLEKMKAAFFTTKDSGDGKRGFGLGLAICRKIVHLHGGTLNITSQIGKGTTVQVDLPSGSLPVLIAAEPLVDFLPV